MARTFVLSGSSRSPRRRVRRAVPWLVAVVVVTGGTAAGVTLPGGGGPSYRLAEVTTGSPTAELTAVGTLVPVDQAAVSFGEAGTVATVTATVGERVTAGQTLATLVAGPLQASVDRAGSQLATAQATLAAAQASETAASTTSSTQPGTSATSVASAQAAVLADQRALDRDEHTAEVDLTAAERSCGAVVPTSSGTADGPLAAVGPAAEARPAPGTSPTSGGAGAGTSPTSGGAGAGTSPTSGGAGAGTSGTTCAGALGQVAHDQAAVSSDTATLESDEAALAAALSHSSATGGGGASTVGSGSALSSAAPAASATGSPGAATPASPQQLASDQAAVDVATVQLTAAQRALADATLTTPLSGTVAQVGLVPGQGVAPGASGGAASASGSSVVIVAPGADEVDLAVPVTTLPELSVGQSATVVPDATGNPVRGTVSTIGLVATTSSSGVTTYPVTVTVAAGSGLPLSTGGQASVAIVVGHATDVTVVPTSAVHRIGAVRTVDVDQAGTVAAVRVTTGVVGARWTEVTTGVRRGQEVVVADLAAPLPTATTGRGAFGALAGVGFGGPRGAAGAGRAGGG